MEACARDGAASARAYTMIELVLSLSIAAILLLAMQSTVMVAARAIPDGTSVSSRIVGGGPPVATLSSDLFYATAVTEMTAIAITFTVPDRDGDGNRDHPLRLVGYCGHPAHQAIQWRKRCQRDSQRSILQSRVRQAHGTCSDDLRHRAETLLSSNTGGSSSFGVTSSAWPAQYIQPTFPVTPTTWAVTRVQIQAKTSGDGPRGPTNRLRSGLDRATGRGR